MEVLGGPPTPGIGFGSGIERIILEMVRQEVPVSAVDSVKAVVVSVGPARKNAAALATSLRLNGISTILAPERSFKAQMRFANQQSAAFAVILGERELLAGTAAVKPLLSNAPQVDVPIAEVTQALSQAHSTS
jgi:histidyl-tRNA synthetase